MFGYERAELIGRQLDVLLAPSICEDSGSSRGFRWTPARRPKEGRKTLMGRHHEGHRIPLTVAISQLESQGTRWYMVIAHDLTEQHAMTERLHLLGAALGAADNGIAITDFHGVCQWINPGFTSITGYTSDEIIGQPLSQLRSGVHDDRFFEELWTTISAGHSWHGEIYNRHNDDVFPRAQPIWPQVAFSRKGNGLAVWMGDLSEGAGVWERRVGDTILCDSFESGDSMIWSKKSL